MPPTDEDLKVRDFNESFYRSDPADYLETKLQLLMLAGGKQYINLRTRATSPWSSHAHSRADLSSARDSMEA